MPKVLEDAKAKIQAKGVPESNAYAIATSSLQKAGKLPKKKGKGKHPPFGGKMKGKVPKGKSGGRPYG